MQRKNHLKRILSTGFSPSASASFSVLLIAEKYTEPIKKIAQASKRIAEGELVKIRDRNRKDEIGVLIKSYNEMVDKLKREEGTRGKLKRRTALLIGQALLRDCARDQKSLNFLSLCIRAY